MRAETLRAPVEDSQMSSGPLNTETVRSGPLRTLDDRATLFPEGTGIELLSNYLEA